VRSAGMVQDNEFTRPTAPDKVVGGELVI